MTKLDVAMKLIVVAMLIVLVPFVVSHSHRVWLFGAGVATPFMVAAILLGVMQWREEQRQDRAADMPAFKRFGGITVDKAAVERELKGL
jgi:hypothetical protein